MAVPEEKETKRADCPNCGGERTCVVHGRTTKEWQWSDNQGHTVDGGSEHLLLECRGCETVFYARIDWDSEDVQYWYDENGDTQGEYSRYQQVTYPKPTSRTRPRWLDSLSNRDETLYAILNEMYLACDNNSFILAAVGLRTALDRATEMLEIRPALTFDAKLKELKSAGWIGDTEYEILKVVTDAGNAAAHRGWQPDDVQIFHLVQAMEVFLQRAFIVGKLALSIKEKIPPKPQR